MDGSGQEDGMGATSAQIGGAMPTCRYESGRGHFRDMATLRQVDRFRVADHTPAGPDKRYGVREDRLWKPVNCRGRDDHR
jgi:hypothetical protein